MAVGENIRQVRISKGLTQKQLGELCGMADSAIRRYELGKANPKIETISKIAKALNVSVTYLVDLTPIEKELEYLKEDRYIVSGNVLKKRKIEIEQKKKKLLTISDEDEFFKEIANLQLEEETLFSIALDHFFVKLNRSGKEEAIKRIEELTQIEKYTSKDYIESSVNDILKLNKREKPIDSEMP